MQRLLRMPFAIKNHTRTPIWSGPGEDDEFQYKKELNQRAIAATAAIVDVIKSQRSAGKKHPYFLSLMSPCRAISNKSSVFQAKWSHIKNCFAWYLSY